MVPADAEGATWIAKGIALGLTIFVVGTFFFLAATVRPRGSHAAVGASVLTGMTFHNPLCWTALLACLMLGVSLAESWPVPVKP